MTDIKVKKVAEKRFAWSHEEWALSKNFQSADEFETWLSNESKYFIRCNSGFYAQCVIVCIESKGDEFLAYVDAYKGKYPPWYTAEELAVLDIDELRKQPAKIKWDEDWEWTTLRKTDFPLRLKEVVFLYPPQEPAMPWLFLSPEESGLDKMKI